MEITGRTALVGIFGDPVAHTFSPAMHNAAFDALGLDWRYVAFHVAPAGLADAMAGVRALGLRGINVTVPHKEAVLPHLDDVDEPARRIRAVNTVIHRNGKLKGTNTDGAGFVRSLKEEGFPFKGRRVCVLGAGGAARAVCFSLLEEGVAFLRVVNRTKAKARILSEDLNRFCNRTEAAGRVETLGDFDLLVNTTSLGLHADDPLPLDASLLRRELTVCDLIYNPVQSRLLAEAEAAGARAINGLGMLLWQGVLAFEHWTGREAPVESMRDALGRVMGKMP